MIVGGYKPRNVTSVAIAQSDESDASFAPQLNPGVMLGQLVQNARAGAGGNGGNGGNGNNGRAAGKSTPGRKSADNSATPKTEPSYQVLYIQMEYCEGKTLREVIDKVMS